MCVRVLWHALVTSEFIEMHFPVVILCAVAILLVDSAYSEKVVHLVNMRQKEYPIATDRIAKAMDRINQDDKVGWKMAAIIGAKRELGIKMHYVLKAKIEVKPDQLETCDIDIVEKWTSIKCAGLTFKKPE